MSGPKAPRAGNSKTSHNKTKKKPKTAAPQNTSYKLLRSLAHARSYATQAEFGPAGPFDVFSTRDGVSLRTGSAFEAEVKELVSQGVAEWKRGRVSGRRRLRINAAGLARLARLDAGDAVEPFFAQHQQTAHRQVEAGGVTRRVVIDNCESPLAWLATRRNGKGQALLNPAFLEAGERLRRDLTFAQMLPRVTASWDPSLGGGDRHSAPISYSETVIAARQRASAALRAAGPEFAGLLMDVCGFLKGLELIETERLWPRRSAKLVLELALSVLARHYGLETHARGPRNTRGVQHWGSEDYRPSINPPPKHET